MDTESVLDRKHGGRLFIEQRFVTSGVSRGSVLGQLLLIIYIKMQQVLILSI